MKPITGRRPWEKNSRAGRSFWLPPRIGHRYEVVPKGSGQESGSAAAKLILAPDLFLLRHPLQRFSCNSKHSPFIQRHRAQTFVKLYRGFIPIQDGPLEPAAVSLTRKPCKISKHGSAESFPAHFGDDEKIFEIQSGLSKKGRKIVEEHCECDGLVAVVAEDDFRGWPLTEKTLAQKLFRDDGLLRKPLIFG